MGAGAEKRKQPGGVESISSAGVMELRIHVSVSAMMSNLWLSVRSSSTVTCWGEHRASIDGADAEVCRVSGTWIGLDIPTEKQCGGK